MLYPWYLSLPLHLIKWMGLDTQYLVRASPYLGQALLATIGDCYFKDLSIKLIGGEASSVALILYMSNSFYNQYVIRCFGNSVEAIATVVAFRYFIDSHRDRNLYVFAFLIALVFCIRNSSIIGWIPLMFIQVYLGKIPLHYNLDGIPQLLRLLKACILVSVPTIALIVLADSVYYGELTFTLFNFF